MSDVSIRDIGPVTYIQVWGPSGRPGHPGRVSQRQFQTGDVFEIRPGQHRFRVDEDGTTYEQSIRCPRGQEEANPFQVRVLTPLRGSATRALPATRAIEPPRVQAVRRHGPAPSRTVREGAAPLADTVVYIHGIGNKPPASVLKCQWDQALFGTPMGDRTRMAYWVNRDHHPVPLATTCADADLAEAAADAADSLLMATLAGASLPRDENDEARLRRLVASVTDDRERQEWLGELALRMQAAAEIPLDDIAETMHRLRGERTPSSAARRARPRGRANPLNAASRDRAIDDDLQRYSTRVLPLPEPLRRLIARQISSQFIRDAYDFLFVEERRKSMLQALADRLNPGGGEFVIVAHSLGSLIAYELLRHLDPDACRVRMLLTIGSPLGMQEVQDVFRAWGADPLRVPACVASWVNVADRLDPVAIDGLLSDDIEAEGGVGIVDFCDWGLNEESPRHPHAATGYLRSAIVRTSLRPALNNAFAQSTGRFVVSRDLTDEMEDATAGQPHRTLIELADDETRQLSVRDLATSADAVVRHIRTMVDRRPEGASDPCIDVMRRYVAADLTRGEVEELRTLFSELNIDRVWRNARKRALINVSTDAVQARPANQMYGATGRNIGWAVLDTGIAGGHPHFKRYENVRRQWDCTMHGEAVVLDPDHPAFDRFDDHGHGTHVAGIIAGEWEAPPSGNGLPQVFRGMAPECALYGFKVLDQDGNGHDSYLIKALDLIAEINERASRLVIHGVNLSLGGNFDPSVYGCGHTPLCNELRRLWRQGVLVCLAAGNEGYVVLQGTNGTMPANLDLSIGDPANLEEAIAVGSVHKRNPHIYGISYFSSRGPTADGRRKPDVVAPGEQILSAFSRWVTRSQAIDDLYIEMSGTSMAAPHTSGVLAAFLSARPEFIGYPDRVKEILIRNSTDLGRDPYAQGAGLPNLVRMLTNT